MEAQIEDDVKKLVTELIQHEKFDHNEENFKRCFDFIMCDVLSDKYLPPSRSATLELLNTFSTKYDYNGFPDYSLNLSDAVATFLEYHSDDKIKDDHKLRMLEFLLLLSCDAFRTETLSSLEDRLKISRAAVFPDEINVEEKINWFQYLQEGSEKFRLPSDESEESEDEFDSQNFLTDVSAICDQEPASIAPVFNELFAGFSQNECVVNDENTEFRKSLKDALESKSWLVQNAQNCWWNGEQCVTSKAVHPSANFGINWEKNRNELLPKNTLPMNQYDDTYLIIREIFWILIAKDNRVSKRMELLRSRVSVPSLIQETFKSLINDLLNGAEEYHCLVFYCDEVLSNDVLQTPFSFQAYASAVRDICQSFLLKVIEQENIVKKQNTIYTLQTINDNLKPHLRVISFLYDVHKECVPFDRSTELSWVGIVRLLSVLFFKYQELTSQALKKILLQIFFKTFKVYGDIIDSWLTEGKLNDWKNEFFIESSEKDDRYVAFPCKDMMKKTDVLIAPFFYKISTNLLNCCHSIEFLSKLNKMHELRSKMLDEGKLIDCFIKEFKKRSFPSRAQMPENCKNKFELKESYKVHHATSECIAQDSNVPYLIQAFSDHLCSSDSDHPKFEHNSSQTLEMSLMNIECVPPAPVLEKVLCDLMDKRETIIVHFFESCIVDDYRFFEHIQNFSELLLTDWNGFYDKIIIRPDKRMWMDSNIVKILLYNSIENKKLRFNHLFHFAIDDDYNSANFEVSISEVVKAIDVMSLHYEVQWPMGMIFTNDVMKNFYSPLLKLILKINLAFSNVTKLRFKDLPQTKLFNWRLRRIEIFRHWVVLFLQKIRAYLSLTVAQNLDWKLIKNSVKINTFSSLQIDYSNYLEKVKQSCLIESEIYEYLNRALNRLWRVCDDVIDLWSKASKLQLTDQDMLQSVELYVQCLWYTSKILQKFAKDKQNPLYDLWSDLCHMLEMHKLNIPDDLSFKHSQQTVL